MKRPPEQSLIYRLAWMGAIWMASVLALGLISLLLKVWL
jgi:hypothetical protein